MKDIGFQPHFSQRAIQGGYQCGKESLPGVEELHTMA
jgi:hypothetical protein